MMRDPRRAADRAEDIREAIGHINADIGALDQAGFLADGKTQRAVTESLIVIGEAAGAILRLVPEIEQQAPGLWAQLKDAYDMRIILTHEYFRVDPTIVWQTIQQDLQPLAGALAAHYGDKD